MKNLKYAIIKKKKNCVYTFIGLSVMCEFSLCSFDVDRYFNEWLKHIEHFQFKTTASRIY